jgi:hypothetical protein
MRFDITSGTDAAHHALYDPSLGTRIDDLEDVDERVASGSLWAVYTAADGSIGYRLQVDEELSSELAAHVRKHTTGNWLRVPSGSLCASGLENVDKPDRKDTTIKIPAGSYTLDVYELDFDWDSDIVPAIKRELGTAYRRENRVGPLGGVLIVGGFFTLIASVLAWSVLVLGIGVALIALGILVLRVGLPNKEYFARRDQIAAEFPELVVVLRALTPDADTSAFKGELFHLVD